MPCYTFDVLGVFHQDTHAFKIGVGVNCQRCYIACTDEGGETLTLPYPNRLITTTTRKQRPSRRVRHGFTLRLVALQRTRAFPLTLAIFVLLPLPNPDI